MDNTRIRSCVSAKITTHDRSTVYRL